jgi:hypothetical protein
MTKTAFKVRYSGSIWPAVEKWAAESDYILEIPGDSARFYFRELKESDGKIRLAISQVSEDVQIKAWFSDSIQDELAIDSPSLYSALPRKMARSELQALLKTLGYKPPDKRKRKKKDSIAFKFGRSIRKLSGKK